MQKIKKNLTAIQKKFQSLKATHSMYEEPTPIGQIAQLMTYGVVSEAEVETYLAYVHSSQQIEDKEKPNQNWMALNIQQMILFLDKVIKYRNINKTNETGKKQRLNLMPVKKRKMKKKISQTHQNPYIPQKIQVGRQLNGDYNEKGQLLAQSNIQNIQNFLENAIQEEESIQSPYLSEQEIQEEQTINTQDPASGLTQDNGSENKIKTKQQSLDLPEEFKNLPVQERYQILIEKYYGVKDSLEKKFNSIYKHYRKEMYLPHESFQKNNELLIDLRLFLKYYRQFQISKKYKANRATDYFKKLALNGLWLDYEKFLQIHYQLIQLLSMNDKQLNQRLQNGEINDKKKVNDLKKSLSKSAKLLIQNLLKLKDLTELISDEKIKKIFNDNSSKKIVKKIVQVHSGLIKEDVLTKLNERNQQRKKRSMILSNNSLLIRYQSQNSPQKQSFSPFTTNNEEIQRSSPHKLSIYKQLQIPKLRSRELKKSSIYSSLQLLNMHKQKQKLKLLINEEENQKYLQAYFKKEKLLNKLIRSNSISLNRNDSQSSQKTNTYSLIANNSSIFQRKESALRNSLSLPRMKFS